MTDNSGRIEPADMNGWRHELRLIGHMSRINQQITSYIMRSLDADAGRTEATPPIDEAMLGAQLIVVGKLLADRAENRQPGATEMVIDEVDLIEPNRGEQ